MSADKTKVKQTTNIYFTWKISDLKTNYSPQSNGTSSVCCLKKFYKVLIALNIIDNEFVGKICHKFNVMCNV